MATTIPTSLPLISSIDQLLLSLPESARAVYRYWYRTRPDVPGYVHDTALWFRGGPQVDLQIKTLFEDSLKSLLQNQTLLNQWTATPRGVVCVCIYWIKWLEICIVEHQLCLLSVLMVPGLAIKATQVPSVATITTTAAAPLPVPVPVPLPAPATATTTTTIGTAVTAPPAGLIGLAPAEELFVWMTLEHSESLPIVQMAVHGLTSLLLRTEQPQQNSIQRMLRVAQQHYDVLGLWGRYPHRNEVLGRKSTDEEVIAPLLLF